MGASGLGPVAETAGSAPKFSPLLYRAVTGKLLLILTHHFPALPCTFVCT